MPNRPSKAALRQAGWSSVPVAKPICVSPLECPSENMRWAWEGDESPLGTSQLSCRGAPPPSYHAPHLFCHSPLHSSTSIRIFPGCTVDQMSLHAHNGQSFTPQNCSCTSFSNEKRRNKLVGWRQSHVKQRSGWRHEKGVEGKEELKQYWAEKGVQAHALGNFFCFWCEGSYTSSLFRRY